jgi:hypothetical protein
MRDTSPVFVVGSARSGNTLLYHMLLSSGHFPQYRTEPAVFDLLIPRFGDFRHRRNREKLMKYWVRSKQCCLTGLDPQQLTALVLNKVSSAGNFLTAVMESMARAQGYRRWAVWGPDNLLHLSVIKRQIPGALFVHIIRDGRDVACGLHAKAFIRPFPWDRCHRLLVSALHWKWKVRRGRRVGHELGNDYLEVRFEDLVLKPQQTLAWVGDFIAMPLDYDFIQNSKIGAVSTPNTSFPAELHSGGFAPVGRWQKLLTSKAVLELESLIGDELQELGYQLSSPAPAKPSLRLRSLEAVYPRFYSFKEWSRLTTPLGRFVNVNRLGLTNSLYGRSRAQGDFN